MMALLMDLKVVKVGDIDAPPEEQSYLLPETSRVESNEIALNQFTRTPTSHSPDLGKIISEELELPKDGGVPENWPQIPQLSRRRSCVANEERTNCVNKAVEHLKLLLGILTDSVQKAEVSLISVEALKDYKNHAQLKVIVQEVMLLLAWLHDDCQKIEDKLISAKVVESQISSKIDELSRQKLITLNKAVESEYVFIKKKIHESLEENISLDSIRLNCQNKVKSVQNINSILKKDIATKNDYIPIVQNKTLLENQQIDKIQNAINEAEQIMCEIVKKRAKTDSHVKETVNIINKEKHAFDLELNAACHEFNVAIKAAENIEKNYFKMSKGIVVGKKQIEENENKLTILKVKLENHATRSNSMDLTSREQKNTLASKVKDTKRQKIENRKLEVKINEMKDELILKTLEFEEERVNLDSEFKRLADINYAENTNIETLKLLIKKSKKQKISYDHSLNEMDQDIQKLEMQVTTSKDQLDHMKEINKLMGDAEDEKRMKFQQIEMSLLQVVKEIHKEIDVENYACAELRRKNTKLAVELSNKQFDVEEKKEEYLAKVKEVTKNVKEVKEKVERLLLLKRKDIQELVDLAEKKIIMEKIYRKAIQDSEDYLSNLIPLQKKSEEKGKKLWNVLVEKKNEFDRMNIGKDNMAKGKISLETAIVNKEKEIEKLKIDEAEFNNQWEPAFNFQVDTKERLKQVEKRIYYEQIDHEYFMRYRNKTLEDILQKKKESLEENEQLASKYRKVQNTLMQKKNEYVQLSKDTMRLKQALKDFKQLLKFQMTVRYHNKSYIHYRELYHSKQLAYYVNISDGSHNECLQLRCKFKSEVERIIAFFSTYFLTIFPKKEHFLPRINQNT